MAAPDDSNVSTEIPAAASDTEDVSTQAPAAAWADSDKFHWKKMSFVAQALKLYQENTDSTENPPSA